MEGGSNSDAVGGDVAPLSSPARFGGGGNGYHLFQGRLLDAAAVVDVDVAAVADAMTKMCGFL